MTAVGIRPPWRTRFPISIFLQRVKARGSALPAPHRPRKDPIPVNVPPWSSVSRDAETTRAGPCAVGEVVAHCRTARHHGKGKAQTERFGAALPAHAPPWVSRGRLSPCYETEGAQGAHFKGFSQSFLGNSLIGNYGRFSQITLLALPLPPGRPRTRHHGSNSTAERKKESPQIRASASESPASGKSSSRRSRKPIKRRVLVFALRPKPLCDIARAKLIFVPGFAPDSRQCSE